MTKKVYVSSAQKAAAKVMVERRDRTGRPVSDAARKIAGARKSDFPVSREPASVGR